MGQLEGEGGDVGPDRVLEIQSREEPRVVPMVDRVIRWTAVGLWHGETIHLCRYIIAGN